MPTKKPKLSAADIERLNSRFTKGGPDECWLWTGRGNSSGIPMFSLVSKPRVRVSANRVVYERSCGAIPAGNYVLPKCGNRRCLNPKHLYLSTRVPKSADQAAPLPAPTPKTASPLVEPDAPRAAEPVERSPISPVLLGTLDGLTYDDVPAILAEIKACERRLWMLRSLHSLVTQNPHRPPGGDPAQAPAPPAQKPIVSKPPKKQGAKKQPVLKKPSRPLLARRMALFIADTGPKTISELAAAMAATPGGIELQAKSSWFVRSGDLVDVSDAGRAVALEGKP